LPERRRSVIVDAMAMTPEQAAAEKARKLRTLESAAASAILNGATPEEVRARVEIGIADVLDSPHMRRIADQSRATAIDNAASTFEAPPGSAIAALHAAAGTGPRHRAA
jgi:hypothetical protein